MNYRQAIGELIYAMVTCRPDIAFPVTKLSQYSTNPSSIHYEAVKQIFYYLNCTKHEGIHFWRAEECPDLQPSPTSHETETADPESKIQDSPSTLKAAVDADWGGDTTHRRSVSGFALKLAGDTTYYKTRYQTTVALSSTEAEFATATEAGKAILCVRTILEELGIPQDTATILHIDDNGALDMANNQ